MKYICLGYYDKGKHDAMTEAEQNAMFDRCFEYNGHLRAGGHLVLERRLASRIRLDSLLEERKSRSDGERTLRAEDRLTEYGSVSWLASSVAVMHVNWVGSLTALL